MSEERNRSASRRGVLQVIGAGTLLAPIFGLAGCAEDKKAPAAKSDTGSAPSKAAETTKSMADEAKTPEKPASSAGMARLTEDDPQARSLSYVHDANDIDSAKQPRYRPGQVCRNCALYQGAAEEEWGNCSIFPGRQVNAAGWCSVYAPKAG